MEHSQRRQLWACFLIQDHVARDTERLVHLCPHTKWGSRSICAKQLLALPGWVKERYLPPPVHAISRSEGGEGKMKNLRHRGTEVFFLSCDLRVEQKVQLPVSSMSLLRAHGFVFPQDCHAISWTGSDPCTLDGTLSYPWLLESMYICASLVWRLHVCLCGLKGWEKFPRNHSILPLWLMIFLPRKTYKMQPTPR